MNDKLGDLGSSERLIADLYIELRSRVGYWSSITHQTPQARMGYVGQHLVSVVTGFPGGKSGARGYDLVIPGAGHAEIKTCYRVDQLGSCAKCSASVSSLETKCADCGSTEVTRKDDSKWLLSVKTDNDFALILDPKTYYFVLFEFEDLVDATNQNIIASIWEVDPTTPGFVLCMSDYKLNIQANSKSGAPFNLWPYSLKFILMKPNLIYRARILSDEIETLIFPKERGNPERLPLPALSELTSKRTLTTDAMVSFLTHAGLAGAKDLGKKELVIELEKIRSSIGEDSFLESLAVHIYKPLLENKLSSLPDSFKPIVDRLLSD